MIRVRELREALARLPDDAEIMVSVDVSEHGETVAEATKRVFATEFFEIQENEAGTHYSLLLGL